MDSWKIFFTTPEDGHMSLDASVILFAAVLCSTPPSLLCLHHAPPFSSCKTCHQQTFSAWKNGPFCQLSLKLFHSYFSSLIAILASNSKNLLIYLFSPFLPVEVKAIWISKKNFLKTHFSFFFFFFLAATYLQKQFPGKRTHKSLNISRHNSETNIKALLIGICYLFHIPFQGRQHW